MYSINLIYCFLFVFFTPPESPPPVHLTYSLLNKKLEKIGEVLSTKTVEGNEVIYESETQMTVKVVLKQDVYYKLRSVYKNGVMTSCSGKSYVNGKLRTSCVATWKNNHYEIQKDSSSYTINHPISYSGAMLYFHEPPARGQCFSELNGYESATSKSGEGKFVMIDGKTRKQNNYTYKSGYLDNAFINHTLLDIIVRRTK